MRKLVVLNVAALSPKDLGQGHTPCFDALGTEGAMDPLIAPEPALTCPSHATMITGAVPAEHGIIANGWYDTAHAKIFNWGRSDRLLSGTRIWDDLRAEAPRIHSLDLSCALGPQK